MAHTHPWLSLALRPPPPSSSMPLQYRRLLMNDGEQATRYSLPLLLLLKRVALLQMQELYGRRGCNAALCYYPRCHFTAYLSPNDISSRFAGISYYSYYSYCSCPQPIRRLHSMICKKDSSPIPGIHTGHCGPH